MAIKERRQERLQSILLSELNTIINREIEFDGLVTLTYARITKDAQEAHIGVSVIPTRKTDKAVELLDKAKRLIMKQLIRVMEMRRIPTLFFRADFGLDYAAGIEKALMKDNNKL